MPQRRSYTVASHSSQERTDKKIVCGEQLSVSERDYERRVNESSVEVSDLEHTISATLHPLTTNRIETEYHVDVHDTEYQMNIGDIKTISNYMFQKTYYKDHNYKSNLTDSSRPQTVYRNDDHFSQTKIPSLLTLSDEIANATFNLHMANHAYKSQTEPIISCYGQPYAACMNQGYLKQPQKYNPVHFQHSDLHNLVARNRNQTNPMAYRPY